LRLAQRILTVILVVFVALGVVTWRAVRIDFPTRPEPGVSRHLARAEREIAILARVDDLLENYVAASRFSGVVLIAFGDEFASSGATGW